MSYVWVGLGCFVGGIVVARLYWTKAIAYGKAELAKIEAKL
jgi:hypothetical protein